MARIPGIEAYPELPSPFDIRELRDGETWTIQPEKWELGRMTIEPRDGRLPKEILVLRLYVSRADKPAGAAYWDVTGQHTIAQLRGYLESTPRRRWRFVITWIGSGAAGRPMVEAGPAR